MDEHGVNKLHEPQEIAEAVVQKMFAADAASRLLRMRMIVVRPGYAQVGMKVTEQMVNGHGMCHGGIIFSLADSAFAFACNTS
jgi:acyl-CoA thioesterase